jgi:hypothetical protein
MTATAPSPDIDSDRLGREAPQFRERSYTAPTSALERVFSAITIRTGSTR